VVNHAGWLVVHIGDGILEKLIARQQGGYRDTASTGSARGDNILDTTAAKPLKRVGAINECVGKSI